MHKRIIYYSGRSHVRTLSLAPSQRLRRRELSGERAARALRGDGPAEKRGPKSVATQTTPRRRTRRRQAARRLHLYGFNLSRRSPPPRPLNDVSAGRPGRRRCGRAGGLPPVRSKLHVYITATRRIIVHLMLAEVRPVSRRLFWTSRRGWVTFRRSGRELSDARGEFLRLLRRR